ncbi:MAG: S8 family serine peptidase [Oscillospiraceae bacterium]|nr:S8 family serine peptidase [Oscillospiraceae bacterium]
MEGKILKRFLAFAVTAAVMTSVIQPAVQSDIYADASGDTRAHSADYSYSHGGCDINSQYCCDGCDTVYTGEGIKIAVLDSGISKYKTEKRISFVDDSDITFEHGNDMAAVLSDLVPEADIYDVRVLDNSGEGKYTDVNKAITWAVDNAADIIVMSFTGNEASSVLESALEYAEENEVLVVAAAGNDSSRKASYPAAYPTVISAGALDESGEISSYSNFGEIVDIYACASEGTSSAAQYMQESPEKNCSEIRNMLVSGKVKNFDCSSVTEESVVRAAACKSHTFNGSYTTTKKATCTSSGTKVGKCTKCGKVVSTVTIPALGHSASSSWTVTRSATCSSTGTKIKKCTRCGATAQTASIAKTGHTFNGSYTTTKKPTCTAAGTKVGKCTKCGTVVSTVSIPALGHNASSSWTTTKSATCSATGTRVKKCTRCSAVVKSETIAKTAHTFNGSYTTTKAATCTAAGTKVGKCTKCGAVVSTVSIPALGHNAGSWTTTKAATCTTSGTRVKKCTRCSKVMSTETISSTGHTFNGSYTTTKAATCTAAGTKVGKCTKCSAVVSTVSIPALGHSYGSWTTSKAATCTVDGTRKCTCTRSGCTSSKTEVIKASGHVFNGSYDITKAATCTTDGTKVGKCNKCNAVVSTATIPALGHSYGSWTTTKAATCTVDGTRKCTCTRSGCTSSKTEVIKASGHVFNGSYDITKAATCTTDGTKVGKCNKCNAVVSTATIPALGHSYGSWTTTKAATCTEDGMRKCTCTRSGCTSSKTEVIKASGHNFNGSFDVKNATCTEDGYRIAKCTKCGEEISHDILKATGHDHITEIIKPTCTEAGLSTEKCKNCGKIFEMKLLAATGHNYGKAVVTKEPTTTETGLEKMTCSLCGDVKTIVLDKVSVKLGNYSYDTFFFNAEGYADAFIHSWAMVDSESGSIYLEIESNQDWTMSSDCSYVKLTTTDGSSYGKISGTKGKSAMLIKADAQAITARNSRTSTITFTSGTYTKKFTIDQYAYDVNGEAGASYDSRIKNSGFYNYIAQCPAKDYILGYKLTDSIITGKCSGYDDVYYAVQTDMYDRMIYPRYIIYKAEKRNDADAREINIQVIEACNMSIVKSGTPMITAEGHFRDSQMIVAANSNDMAYKRTQFAVSAISNVAGFIFKPVTCLGLNCILAEVGTDDSTSADVRNKDRIEVALNDKDTVMDAAGHCMDLTIFSASEVQYNLNLTFSTGSKSASYNISK